MTKYEEIHHRIFQLLETELPSFLSYHSPLHTAYVIEQAELIASHENINSNELILIKIASMLHDIGFIQQYKNHEEAGCQIAIQLLEELSFSQHEIDQVCGMIMATKIPQSPRTKSEKIVADADLEYLGTDLFVPVSRLLFQELHYIDDALTSAEFQRIQIDFLTNHTYHTDFCIRHREPKKKHHLQQLKEGLI